MIVRGWWPASQSVSKEWTRVQHNSLSGSTAPSHIISGFVPFAINDEHFPPSLPPLHCTLFDSSFSLHWTTLGKEGDVEIRYCVSIYLQSKYSGKVVKIMRLQQNSPLDDDDDATQPQTIMLVPQSVVQSSCEWWVVLQRYMMIRTGYLQWESPKRIVIAQKKITTTNAK